MSDLSDYDNYFKRCNENESHDAGMGYDHLSCEIHKLKHKFAILINDKKRPYFYTNFFSIGFSAGLGVFTSFAVFTVVMNRR